MKLLDVKGILFGKSTSVAGTAAESQLDIGKRRSFISTSGAAIAAKADTRTTLVDKLNAGDLLSLLYAEEAENAVDKLTSFVDTINDKVSCVHTVSSYSPMPVNPLLKGTTVLTDVSSLHVEDLEDIEYLEYIAINSLRKKYVLYSNTTKPVGTAVVTDEPRVGNVLQGRTVCMDYDLSWAMDGLLFYDMENMAMAANKTGKGGMRCNGFMWDAMYKDMVAHTEKAARYMKSLTKW